MWPRAVYHSLASRRFHSPVLPVAQTCPSAEEAFDESFTQFLEPEKLSKLNFKDERSKFLLPAILQDSTTQNTSNFNTDRLRACPKQTEQC